MTGYRISKAAQADLIKIAQYGDENYGIERSNQFRDQLKKQFEILAQNPRLFRERWELSPPVRICPFKPYVKNQPGLKNYFPGSALAGRLVPKITLAPPPEYCYAFHHQRI